MKKMLIFVALPVAVMFFAGCPSGNNQDPKPTADVTNPTISWKVPVEVSDTPNATQNDYYNFGWQSFIALNWPSSDAYRGMPDTTQSIGAKTAAGSYIPAVWERWKEQYDIFLPYGKNPGPWDWLVTDDKTPIKLLRMFSKNDTNKVHDAFDEATGQPLIAQDSEFVRYEVRVDESEYTYFLNNGYYNADSQINAVKTNSFVGFPKGGDALSNSMPAWAQYGATEVKASWRVFKPNTPASVLERYFHRTAILIDQYGNRSKPVEVGLVGLHILRLTPSTHATWYWASFEQVDNLKLQPQYGGTLPATPTFNTNPAKTYGDSGFSYQPAAVKFGQPLPPAIPVGVSSPPFQQGNKQLDAINTLFTKLLKGTPFQYYQMIGTVNPPGKGKGDTSYTNVEPPYPNVTVNTSWMANSTLETYIASSNCITCHIGGYPQGVDSPYNGNLQVFTFLPGLAQSSSNKPAKPVTFTLLKRR